MCICPHDNRRKCLFFIFLTFFVRVVRESTNEGFVEPPMKLTLTFITINASNHFVSLLLNSQQLQTVTIKAVKTISWKTTTLYFTFAKKRKLERAPN